MKKIFKLFAASSIFLMTALPSWAQNTVTLSTYYPAPSGNYNQTQFKPLSGDPVTCGSGTEGTVYYSSATHELKVCTGTAPFGSIGGIFSHTKPGSVDNVFLDPAKYPQQAFGIGTSTPGYLLDVEAGSGADGVFSLMSNLGAGSTDKWLFNANNLDKALHVRNGGNVAANDRLTLTNDGKLGIGTTAVGDVISPLTIKSPVLGGLGLLHTNSNAGGTTTIQLNTYLDKLDGSVASPAAWIGMGTTQPLNFYVNNTLTPLMSLNPPVTATTGTLNTISINPTNTVFTGNVGIGASNQISPLVVPAIPGNLGIGITAPGQRLDVYGAGSQIIRLRSMGNTSPTPTAAMGAGIVMGDVYTGDSPPTPVTYTMGVNGIQNKFLISSGGAIILSTFMPANPYFLIDSSNTLVPGNIGMGTSAPAAHLHVSGAGNQFIKVESTDSNGLGAGITFTGADTGGPVTIPQAKSFTIGYADGELYSAPNFNSFVISTGADLTQPKLVVAPNGNVGINLPTASPNASLDVYGTVHINNLLQLEPQSTVPNCVNNGLLYVRSTSPGTLCFCDGSGIWKAVYPTTGTCN